MQKHYFTHTSSRFPRTFSASTKRAIAGALYRLWLQGDLSFIFSLRQLSLFFIIFLSYPTEEDQS